MGFGFLCFGLVFGYLQEETSYLPCLIAGNEERGTCSPQPTVGLAFPFFGASWRPLGDTLYPPMLLCWALGRDLHSKPVHFIRSAGKGEAGKGNTNEAPESMRRAD